MGENVGELVGATVGENVGELVGAKVGASVDEHSPNSSLHSLEDGILFFDFPVTTTIATTPPIINPNIITTTIINSTLNFLGCICFSIIIIRLYKNYK